MLNSPRRRRAAAHGQGGILVGGGKSHFCLDLLSEFHFYSCWLTCYERLHPGHVHTQTTTTETRSYERTTNSIDTRMVETRADGGCKNNVHEMCTSGLFHNALCFVCLFFRAEYFPMCQCISQIRIILFCLFARTFSNDQT